MQSCQKAKLVKLHAAAPRPNYPSDRGVNIAAANCYNYQTMAQIRDNPNIDAIYDQRNATHKDFVIRAAGRGKHVICRNRWL